MEIQSVGVSTAQAKELSSQVLDIIGLKGELTDVPPGASRSEQEPERLYRITHPWSLSGAPEADMERAMQRLREQLPRHRWKVLEYGPGKSKAGYLELTANSEKYKFSVNVMFKDARKPGAVEASLNKTSALRVSLVSAYFRTPEGEHP